MTLDDRYCRLSIEYTFDLLLPHAQFSSCGKRGPVPSLVSVNSSTKAHEEHELHRP